VRSVRADLGGAVGIEGMSHQDSTTTERLPLTLADSAASPLERSNVQQSDPVPHTTASHALQADDRPSVPQALGRTRTNQSVGASKQINTDSLCAVNPGATRESQEGSMVSVEEISGPIQ
jgi:hypothetical protein